MNHNNQPPAEEEAPLTTETNTTAIYADNIDAIAADMPQQEDSLSNDINKLSTPNLTTNNTSPIITTDGIDDNTTGGSSSMMLTSTKKDDILNVDTVSLYL